MSMRCLRVQTVVLLVAAACGGGGDSGGGDPPPPTESIRVPTNFSARVAAGPTVRLTWLDNSTGETSFQLQRATSGSTTFVDLANLPPDSVDFDDVAVEPSTNYSYRIRTIGPTVVSPFSAIVDVRTDSVPPTLTIESFATDTIVTREGVVRIHYVNDDRDSVARTHFVADRDGNLATTADTYALTGSLFDADGVPQTAVLDFADVPPGDYRLFGTSVDGNHDPVVVAATGLIQLRNRSTVRMLDMTDWSLSAVAERDDGLVFVAGAFRGTVSFGPGQSLTANGTTDAVLALLDLAGATRWALQIGVTDETRATHVVPMADGGAVVCGEYGASFSTPPRALPDADSVFVARYLADGTRVWIHQLTTDGRDRAGDLRIAPDGSVLVTSWSETASAKNASAVWLEIAGGAEIRRVNLGTGSAARIGMRPDHVFAIAQDRDGDVYVGMRGRDFNLVWVTAITGSGTEHAVGAVALTDGSFVVAGTTDSPTVSFGTGGLAVTTSGATDGWVAHFANDGRVLWARSVVASVVGDVVSGLVVLDDDSVRVAGTYGAGAVFKPGTALPADGARDAFVAAYDRDGNFRFVRRYGSPADESGVVLGSRVDGSLLLGVQSLADTLTIHEGDPDSRQFVGPLLGSNDNGVLARLHGHGALAGNLDASGTIDGVQTHFVVRGDTAFMDGSLDTDASDIVRQLIDANPQLARIAMGTVVDAVDVAAAFDAGRRVRLRDLATEVADGGVVAAGAVDFFLGGTDRSVTGSGELRVHSWEDNGTAGSSLPANDPRHQPYIDYYIEMDLPQASDYYWFTLNACAPACTYPMTRQEMLGFGVVTR